MADRTGYTAAELAAMQLAPHLSHAANKVRLRAEREGWPYVEGPARGGRGTVRVFGAATLPEAIRTAIAERAKVAGAPPMVEAKPEHAAIALERVRIVKAILELVTHGATYADAIESTRGAHSPRNVRRWIAVVRDLPAPEWMRALLPAWRGPTEMSECHPEAWRVFVGDYLRGSKPAASECYRRMTEAATAHGWSPVPGLGALMRRLRREISPRTILLKREGDEALARTFPALERDKSMLRANDIWNADGHVVDVPVLWPDGIVERPTMVGIQDVAHAPILAFRCDRSENATLIRLAFADAASEYGLPSIFFSDNGRAFASKELTGGAPCRFRGQIRPEDPKGTITQLVDEVAFTLPYHGQSKPIERAWRDLCESISRDPAFEAAYLGSNPTVRPHNYDPKKAIPLDVFLAVAKDAITRHNERVGRRSKMAAGRSLMGAYKESLETIERRVLTDEQQRLLYLSSTVKKLAAESGTLTFWGNRYWSKELNAVAGQRVVARFDPRSLHDGVHIYTLDGRHVGWADCVERGGFRDQAIGQAHNRARAAHVKTAKAVARLEVELGAADVSAIYRGGPASSNTPHDAPPASVVKLVPRAPKLSKASAILAEEAATRRQRELEDSDEAASIFAGAFARLAGSAND